VGGRLLGFRANLLGPKAIGEKVEKKSVSIANEGGE
jgi:hypothetical protein